MLAATDSKFDLSDVDVLDDVLTIASEIIDENAADPGKTRIERLARYVAQHLGCEPSVSQWDDITEYAPTQADPRDDIKVSVLRGRIALATTNGRQAVIRPLSKEDAVSLAVALLRSAEAA